MTGPRNPTRRKRVASCVDCFGNCVFMTRSSFASHSVARTNIPRFRPRPLAPLTRWSLMAATFQGIAFGPGCPTSASKTDRSARSERFLSSTPCLTHSAERLHGPGVGIASTARWKRQARKSAIGAPLPPEDVYVAAASWGFSGPARRMRPRRGLTRCGRRHSHGKMGKAREFGDRALIGNCVS